jgi:hypothetical protein
MSSNPMLLASSSRSSVSRNAPALDESSQGFDSSTRIIGGALQHLQLPDFHLNLKSLNPCPTHLGWIVQVSLRSAQLFTTPFLLLPII